MPINIPPISEVGTKVSSTIVHAIAIGMSVVRLYLRVKKDHVWWDDQLAVTAAAADSVYMMTLWLKPLDPQYELNGIVYYNTWLLYFPSFLVIWMTRTSLWLSLARLYPPQHDARRLSLLLVAIFSVLGVFCTVGGTVGCPGSEWGIRFQYGHCFTSQTLGRLSQYEDIIAATGALDIICDVALVGAPVYLLSRMRQIPRKRKIVIIFLCCGSVLTLLGIVAVGIIVYGPFADTEDKIALIDCLTHLSSAASLLSANLLVVGTAFYVWAERRIIDYRNCTQRRVPNTRRPSDRAMNVTYNTELTRISTSGSDPDSTVDYEFDESVDEQELRPLFWSVQHIKGRAEYDVSASVAERATV